MTISTQLIIYVALYRLTVLTVGALSIYFAFRLFTRIDGDQQDSPGATLLDTRAWKLRFTVSNFWPAAFFALFGTGLIGVMLWQGAPQLSVEDIRELGGRGTVVEQDAEARDKPQPVPGLCAVRPLSPEAEERLTLELGYLKQPGLTLEDAAEHLGHIARIWQMQGRGGEALAMARLAYLYGPAKDMGANLSLYAELLAANGRVQEAVEAHKKLVELEKKPQERAAE